LTQGQSFSGTVGTFTLDPGVTFSSGALDWGDLSSPDFNPTVTPLWNNTYRVASSHAYASPGRYRISLQLNEPNPTGGFNGVSDLPAAPGVPSAGKKFPNDPSSNARGAGISPAVAQSPFTAAFVPPN
jgi:hypothetical protein